MKNINSLVDVIVRLQDEKNNGITFINTKEEEFFSYETLFKTSLEILGALQSYGIKPGDELIFQFKDNYNFITYFWASVLGGFIPVPLTTENSSENLLKISRIWKDLNRPVIISDKTDKSLKNEYKYIFTGDLAPLKSKGKITCPQSSDMAFIQYSSGSTGAPKGVMLTHENIITNINAIIAAAKITSDDSSLSWLPLSHDMGLIGFHLTPLMVRADHHFMSPYLFIRDPLLWLKKASFHNVSILVSPNFGYKHFLHYVTDDKLEHADINLGTVRLVVNGAEMISGALCDEFVSKLNRYGLKEEVMYPVYGLAEAVVAVSFPEPGKKYTVITVNRSRLKVGDRVEESSHGDSITFVGVGRPVQDCSVSICDNLFQELPEGHIGNIIITGKNVTGGYYNNPEGSNNTFIGEDRLNTGDIGFFKNGTLFIAGRVKDLLIVNGQNYFADDLERIVSELNEIQEGSVVFSSAYNENEHSDEILCFIKHTGPVDSFLPVAESAGRKIFDTLCITIDKIIPVKLVPKTTSGKIKRFQLKEQYLDGRYDEHIQSINNLRKKYGDTEPVKDLQQIRGELERILKETLQVHTVDNNRNFYELGLNSLQLLKIFNTIQNRYNIKVPLGEVAGRLTVNDLSSYISGSTGPGFAPVTKVTNEKYFPASSVQKRLFAIHEFEGDTVIYNLPFALRIVGECNVSLFERSLRTLINRHESLRTTFKVIDGEIVQEIYPAVDFRIKSIDKKHNEPVDEVIGNFIQPFNLDKAPLFRAAVLQVSAAERIFIFDFHHIIADGVSISILMNELVDLLNGAELPEVKVQYKDFANWQNNNLCSPAGNDTKDFWYEQFKDSVPVINFPTDYNRPAERSYDGKVESIVLDQTFTRSIKSLASKNHVSLYTLMLSAYFILIHKYTNRDEIVVGTAVSGRTHPDFENTVGMFVNTLPLKCAINTNRDIKSFFSDMNDYIALAIQHQDYPFEYILDSLSLRNEKNRNPLFDTMFVMENIDLPAPETGGLSIQKYNIDPGVSDFDFSLIVEEEKGKIVTRMVYCTKLFKPGTVQRLLGHYKNLLSLLTAGNDYILLKDISVLSENEKTEICIGFNDTKDNTFKHYSIEQLFEEQVMKNPGSIAVKDLHRELTFSELHDMSNRLARYLVESGIGPETAVAVISDKSVYLVICFLAVIKAGGVYVPVNPEQPADRTAYVLKDCCIKHVLADRTLSLKPGNENVPVTDITRLDDIIYSCSGNTVTVNHSPKNLAYIVYTSGSTGSPKGVMIEHRSLVNLYLSVQSKFQFKPGDRILQTAAVSFDSSIGEFVMSLLSGATLIILPNERASSPEEVERVLLSEKISAAFFTPSFLSEISGTFPDLHTVIVGGEVCPPSLADSWCRGRRFFNNYGPTETTIVSSMFVHDNVSYNSVPIGKPVANTAIYILDHNMNPCPPGVEGEIWIGGVGLARGYINPDSLTREKFIGNPFMQGTRMYRTGDFGRFRPDGNILFNGRYDTQVKVRGNRIELQEIAVILEGHPLITKCAVILNNKHDVERLVCFYTGRELSSDDLRIYCLDNLPQYMVPSLFIFLDSIPLTRHGKTDYTILRNNAEKLFNAGKEKIKPKTVIENRLYEIWKEVLEHDNFGVDDDLYAAGGHSLKATRIVSRINNDFQINFPLKSIFYHNTIYKLSREIETVINNDKTMLLPPINRVDRDKNIPLSFAQERMWFLNQLDPRGVAYNMPFSFRVRSVMDLDAVKKTVEMIVRRHDSLRTTFSLVDGKPLQHIKDSMKPDFTVLDYGNEPFENIEDRVRQYVTKEAQTVFDLSTGPLIKCRIVRVNNSDYVILINMHHIISDQWSFAVLIYEFNEIYNSIVYNTKNHLKELQLQYYHFAIWQRENRDDTVLKKQLEYWKEKLHTHTVLELPTDKPRPALRTSNGAYTKMFFTEKIINETREIGLNEGATAFMTLLSCFYILLYRYSGNSTIQVGVPIANRTNVALENQIGTFVNTLVLREELTPDMTFPELLKKVKRTSVEAYENQDLPFEVLVDTLQPERDMSRTPLVQVLFNLANAPVMDNFHPDIEWSVYEIGKIGAQFDLTLNLELEVDKSVTLIYNTDLFDKVTAERLLKHFYMIIKEIIKDPEQRIMDIQLLDDSEKNEIIYNRNNTVTTYPVNRLYSDLFDDQALKNPRSEAVQFLNRGISYKELYERSNRLAHYLINNGVKVKDFVCIYMDRSIEMVVSLLAVMKAGGAYIPLDPDYPADRLRFYLEDSGAKYILTEKKYSGDFTGPDIVKIFIDDSAVESENSDRPAVVAASGDLAYVLYTSGSTGKPKGVQISHRSLINFLYSMAKVPGLGSDDVLLSVTSISFDIQGLELYLPLLSGAKVIIASSEEAVDGLKLLEIIRNGNVTVMQATPATWRMLLEAGWSSKERIKVLCGGEAFPVDITSKLLDRSTSLWNLYGPTETTIWSSVFEIKMSDAPALIGKPIGNTQMYILDNNMKPVPNGVAGNLYIGGDGLARGYLNRPALTKEKFVTNPFANDKTVLVYNTGDVARFKQDGNIEYIGRSDFQVKLRGFRIELGEIESTASRFEYIRQTVAVVREIKPGNEQLALYFVTEDNREIVIEDLKNFLRLKLPDYMVPAAYTKVKRMPLTPNGKIDKKKLPVPQFEKRNYTAPRNKFEKDITGIWSDVLGINKISIYDNFFELGGHSLLATKLISRINRALHLEIPLRYLFYNPTIAGFTKFIQDNINSGELDIHLKADNHDFSMLFPVQPGGNRVPLFMIAGAHENRYLFSNRETARSGYEEDFLRYLANIIPHLGKEQPVYAFRPLGIYSKEKRHSSVKEMAREYIVELKKKQPAGPYIIAGECVGGIVAYEMAQQLLAGNEVPFLILLDTVFPKITARVRLLLRYFKKRITLFCTSYINNRWKESTIKKNTSILSLIRESKSGLFDYYYSATLLKYKPKKYDHIIKMIVNSEYHEKNPSLGWSRLNRENLDIHMVPGNHLTRLSVYGKATGNKLKSFVDEVNGKVNN